LENSLLLARIVGPIMIIAGLGVILNLKACKQMIIDYTSNVALRYIGGFIGLVIGAAFNRISWLFQMGLDLHNNAHRLDQRH
jgi:uncharacterized protein YjeT (DUF2065 family)